MVLAEIITIGDELLIGQVVDTNSAWIGQRLNEIGIKVKQITSVSDEEAHILCALDEASKRADIILMTGGLGPTKDDITKKTLCTYFNTGLKFDDASYSIIESIFSTRGREVTEVNRNQALVPENCEVLLNRNGTAPGMWFNEKNKIFVSMPGIPAEMKGLMELSVLPALKKKFSLPPIIHRTFLTQGIGESMLAELIADWEDALPSNLKLAYLPAAGMVRLRISGNGSDENLLKSEIEKRVNTLIPLIQPYLYGTENQKLEVLIGDLLREQKRTLVTAESCTGGAIAHRITSIAGSSDYYLGSIVPYSNRLKIGLLGVEAGVIEKQGAVSEEVVIQMAQKARKLLNSDYAISTSGIAGPTGGSDIKPVGTVWIAISGPEETITRKLQLGSHRDRIILETGNHALNELRRMLLARKV